METALAISTTDATSPLHENMRARVCTQDGHPQCFTEWCPCVATTPKMETFTDESWLDWVGEFGRSDGAYRIACSGSRVACSGSRVACSGNCCCGLSTTLEVSRLSALQCGSSKPPMVPSAVAAHTASLATGALQLLA